MARESRLPTAKELRQQKRKSMDRLTLLFERLPLKLSGHRTIGLWRLETQFRMAMHMLRFMKDNGFKTIDELGYFLFCEGEERETVGTLRFPVAFHPASQKIDDEYLLALCHLEWDPQKKRWVATPDDQ